MQYSWRRDLLWLFAATLLFFCIGLGVRPYLTPSEARYIEAPMQMLVTHDWLTPRLNGVPYFEKPPLFYWMQASVMQFFGTGEFAGRIATALLATCMCLITYALGRLLYDRLSGLLAAMVIATCALGYSLSRVAMVDMPVSLFMTACIGCFLAAQKYSSPHRGEARRGASLLHGENQPPLQPSPYGGGRFYWLMYVASALAVLSKGLIGMVIPGLVIGAWIAITRRWHILKEARLIPGLLLFLIIAAPWHILMAMKHPAFVQFYFIHEHFQRFLTDEAKRVQPWWFFIAITIAGLLPYTGVLYAAVKPIVLRRNDPDKLFLLLWIVLPLLFFSASHSKLAPYIFPIFPPLCILTGHYLAECWEKRDATRTLRINGLAVAAIFTAILIVYYCVPLPLNTENKLDFEAGITFPMLAPTMAALAWLYYVIFSNRPARVLIIALALLAVTIDISANYVVAAVDHATVKPLLAVLKKRLHKDDSVAAYGAYFQDLPVYLHRNVIVGDYTGELDFGYTHFPQTHSWMLTRPEFWRYCAADKRPFYVFMKRTTYESLAAPATCRLRVLAKYGKTVLLEKITP